MFIIKISLMIWVFFFCDVSSNSFLFFWFVWGGGGATGPSRILKNFSLSRWTKKRTFVRKLNSYQSSASRHKRSSWSLVSRCNRLSKMTGCCCHTTSHVTRRLCLWRHTCDRRNHRITNHFGLSMTMQKSEYINVITCRVM